MRVMLFDADKTHPVPLLYFVCLCLISQHATAQDAAKLYADRAENFFGEKSFDSAFVNYERASRLYDKEGNSVEMVNTITRAGQSLLKLRKMDQAVPLLAKYVEDAEKIEKTHEVREAFYNTLSELYYYSGDAFSSLTYHEIVYDINVTRGDTPPDKEMDIVRIMGVLNGNVGQLQNAIYYYTQYAELVNKVHGAKHMLMSDAYNYLGVIYRHMGEYDLALDYYKKSISIAEQYTPEERAAISPRFRSVAPVYNNIGSVYHSLKNHENALSYTLKALSLHEKDQSINPVGLASIYSSLGTTYTKLGRHHEANVNKQKALRMFITAYGESHGRIATELKNIGDTYFDLGDFVTAEKFYEQSLSMNLKSHGVHHPNTAEAYIKIAAIDEVKGDLPKALQNVQQALQCLVQDFKSNNICDNPDIHALCNVKVHLVERLTRKADLLVSFFRKHHDLKILTAAHDTYSHAVSLSEVVRNDLLDSRSKIYLAENSKVLYEKSIRTALELHTLTDNKQYADAAFAIMEKNKSRLLLESLQFSQLKNPTELRQNLFNQENGLLSKLAYYEERILNERVKGRDQDSIKITQWQEGLFETRRKLEAFKLQLQRENPKYHFAKYLNPAVSPSHVQQALKADELLLEFFSGDSAMYMFYATRASSGFISFEEQVQTDIHQMVQGIRNRDLSLYTTLSHQLYVKILEPALKEIADTPQKIIIIPDGIVAYLPFELLLTKQSSTNKYGDLSYAIKDFNFSYRLSSMLMLTNSKNGEPEVLHSFTGFAPHFEGAVVAQRGLPGNIPYAQREVKEISGRFPGEIYLGDQATESNFRTKSLTSKVIHLATHAAIDTEDANFSLLYFASPDSLEDGLLHAFEIFKLQMNAELITLSACNTAVGVYKEGEGVMSLSRAFAYAGCKSIVTSLWPSQDQTTADIMELFYKNLSMGMQKDEALRQAKLTFLEKADNIKSDPFYWAGFVLIGDTEPLEGNGIKVPVLVASVLALALVLMGIVYWRRKHLTRIPG